MTCWKQFFFFISVVQSCSCVISFAREIRKSLNFQKNFTVPRKGFGKEVEGSNISSDQILTCSKVSFLVSLFSLSLLLLSLWLFFFNCRDIYVKCLTPYSPLLQQSPDQEGFCHPRFTDFSGRALVCV